MASKLQVVENFSLSVNGVRAVLDLVFLDENNDLFLVLDMYEKICEGDCLRLDFILNGKNSVILARASQANMYTVDEDIPALLLATNVESL